MDYAAQVNGRVAFKTEYIEFKDQWKFNSSDFRKLFLAFDIKIYPEIKKALFTSEFMQNKKIIATKKAALLAPIKGAYHEIENTSFQTDLLKNTKINAGLLKIMFSYDGKVVCEQNIQIL